MAHKTRWQHLPPRTNEFDLGAHIRRHNAALAHDNKLIVLVIKNVRPTKRGDCSAPFIVVGTRLRLRDALFVEYGRAYVGEDYLVSTYEGMDVRQIHVMSALGREEVKGMCSEMGYEGYEAWKSDLLAPQLDKDDMPIVWYSANVYKAQVPMRMNRWFKAQEARILRDADALEAAPLTMPYGECGRVPVPTVLSPNVTLTR